MNQDEDIQAVPGRYGWFRTLAPIIVGAVACWLLIDAQRPLAGILLLAASIGVAVMLRLKA